MQSNINILRVSPQCKWISADLRMRISGMDLGRDTESPGTTPRGISRGSAYEQPQASSVQCNTKQQTVSLPAVHYVMRETSFSEISIWTRVVICQYPYTATAAAVVVVAAGVYCLLGCSRIYTSCSKFAEVCACVIIP